MAAASALRPGPE
uniref:Uncharacterized protein n=1 Tax=Arundo donax TaxID=35708 RepID=A0A0A8YA85_ARUDO